MEYKAMDMKASKYETAVKPSIYEGLELLAQR